MNGWVWFFKRTLVPLPAGCRGGKRSPSPSLHITTLTRSRREGSRSRGKGVRRFPKGRLGKVTTKPEGEGEWGGEPEQNCKGCKPSLFSFLFSLPCP